MMNIKTTEADGKHYATVVQGDRIVYRTPDYVTARMALADAQCWNAFHGGKHVPTYTLAITPMISGRAMPLPGEYATKGEAWKAVQETFFGEAVTVLEDGREIGTFQWFRAQDEPCPWAPGKVTSVRDLKKWTGMHTGWIATGVQSVGSGNKLGPHRFIRTA
ncbi:hypothetical protein [Streptomyces uncialis]|uniref:Uncharacterized protein n=1 Tax=Streptomyces uncialis TaxID=1048205 RepID=A0A1Q4UY81_9ACTN|nr:hypothetical protein [Streptomyces uncialis]OKH90483.1 hypothetical protein AB852_35565 [Streptomyces uncialis]